MLIAQQGSDTGNRARFAKNVWAQRGRSYGVENELERREFHVGPELPASYIRRIWTGRRKKKEKRLYLVEHRQRRPTSRSSLRRQRSSATYPMLEPRAVAGDIAPALKRRTGLRSTLPLVQHSGSSVPLRVAGKMRGTMKRRLKNGKADQKRTKAIETQIKKRDATSCVCVDLLCALVKETSLPLLFLLFLLLFILFLLLLVRLA